jgi:putative membrane protein
MYTKFKLPFKVWVVHIWKPVTLVTLYSGLVYILFTKLGYEAIAIPLSIPTLLGTAISIFLGFRNNSAYDRWWEARKVWGAIVNDSRTLIRQAMGFISDDFSDKKAVIESIASKRSAWCYALKNSLRKLPIDPELEKHLTPEETMFLKGHDNIPNGILALEERQIASVFEQGAIDANRFVALDDTLRRLCDAMGKCERIKNTVFPVQYSYFARLSIYIFAALLPFGLVQAVGIFAIPITLFVVFIFFMLELVARFLQDPFENRPNDISMTAISRTIEINLLQLIGEDDVPEKIEDENNILM